MAAKANDTTDTHRMQCMEVWGGNQAIDNSVVMPGLDAWIYSQPYEDDATGGDVHFVSNCASGRITRMLVADVSGHGARVSEIALVLRSLMRRYINYLDQTRFVEAVNREFARIARAGGFATSIAATFWAPTSVLVTCNAGHPRPLWYRAARKQWQFLSDDRQHDDEGVANLPLGVIEPMQYRQFGVRLRKDDLILIYTDSLSESRDAQGAELGEDGLLQIAQGLDPAQPNQLLHMLLQAVDDYRLGTPARDDETILMLRHNGTMPRMAMADRAASMGRLVKMILERLRPGTPPIAWPEMRVETVGGAFINRLNWRWGGKQPQND